MLSSQNAFDHGRHGRCMDEALFSERSRAPPWMQVCHKASNHGHYHGWSVDALCSECMRPWTLSCRPPGCSLVRLHQTMEVILVVPRTQYSMDVTIAQPPGCSLVRLQQTMDVMMVGHSLLCAQNAIYHGHYHAPPPPPAWMLLCLNASDHGRYHVRAMDVLGSEDFGPWTSWLVSECIGPCQYHGLAMDALFSPPQHSSF